MTEDPTPFSVDVVETPDGPVLKVAGDIDLATVTTLVGDAERLLQNPASTLTVDMSGVDFCDSAGINGLVRIRNACRDAGWRFRAVNLRGHIRYVIVELTGLGEFLGVEAGQRED